MGNVACFDGAVGGPVPRTPKQGFKVCVCGGAGEMGKPLCLLMAMDPRVAELSVYDLTISMVPAEIVGADLRHLERRCVVQAYSLDATERPVDHLEQCFRGCHLVLVVAGVPNKDRTMTELLKINANIAKSIVEACGRFCPEAVVGIIVNPLNSVVPAMARLYEKKGLDPMKICGVTTLDVVRANKFVHEETGAPIENIDIPVVGGSGATSGATALPLFSQDRVARKMPVPRQNELLERVRNAGSEITAIKKGKGNAVLAMAYAAARFGKAVLSGLSGQRTVETAFVKQVDGPCPYFSSRVTFGRTGVEKVHKIGGKLSPHEKTSLGEVVELLKRDVQDGLDYAEKTDLCFNPAQAVHDSAGAYSNPPTAIAKSLGHRQ